MKIFFMATLRGCLQGQRNMRCAGYPSCGQLPYCDRQDPQVKLHMLALRLLSICRVKTALQASAELKVVWRQER